METGVTYLYIGNDLKMFFLEVGRLLTRPIYMTQFQHLSTHMIEMLMWCKHFAKDGVHKPTPFTHHLARCSSHFGICIDLEGFLSLVIFTMKLSLAVRNRQEVTRQRGSSQRVVSTYLRPFISLILKRKEKTRVFWRVIGSAFGVDMEWNIQNHLVEGQRG